MLHALGEIGKVSALKALVDRLIASGQVHGVRANLQSGEGEDFGKANRYFPVQFTDGVE